LNSEIVGVSYLAWTTRVGQHSPILTVRTLIPFKLVVISYIPTCLIITCYCVPSQENPQGIDIVCSKVYLRHFC